MKKLWIVSLSIFSVLDFWFRSVKNNWLLWDWPSLDTYPLLMRLANINFLPHDFYTNASSDFSIRSLYALTIFWSAQLFHVSFTDVFKIILAIVTPVFFATLVTLITGMIKRLTNGRTHWATTLVVIGVAIFYMSTHQPIIVAWWEFYPTGTHQWMVVLILMLLALCYIVGQSPHYTQLWLISCIAFVIHPVMVILAVPWLVMFDYLFNQETSFLLPYHLRDYLPIRRLILLSTLGLAIIMLLGNTIGYNPLDHIYVWEHSRHYLPSYWEPIDWYKKFTYFCLVLVALALYCYCTGRKKIAGLFMFFLIYDLSLIGLQYYGVEVLGNSYLAILGPSRGLIFIGLEYCIALTVIILAVLQPIKNFLVIPSINFFKRPLWVASSIGVCVMISVISLLTTVSYLRSPLDGIDAIPETEKGAVVYLRDHAPIDATIMAPHSALTDYIPVIAERNIVVGNGFPFNKKYWPEFSERMADLWGSEQYISQYNGWIGSYYDQYYYTRSKSDIIALGQKYQASYWVAERLPDFKLQLDLPIVYQDDYYLIYQL